MNLRNPYRQQPRAPPANNQAPGPAHGNFGGAPNVGGAGVGPAGVAPGQARGAAPGGGHGAEVLHQRDGPTLLTSGRFSVTTAI